MSLQCVVFLGLSTNYYCRFIKKCAQVAKPLYKLISCENAVRKQNSIKWDQECQEAFDKLKELCTTTPILAYADFEKPFKPHTDASVLGLGDILYQEQDRVEKVISYASPSLSKLESKYPIHKLEFLCLKWAKTNQFHEYLYGNTFDVYTDNNPLTYVLYTAKLNAMGHRQIAGLANYKFHIHYKSGKCNVESDALSRIDWEKCDETIQANSIQATVAAAITGDVANHIESVLCCVQTTDSIFPSISDTPAISKAITSSSRQSHPTHPEPELSISKTVTKPDVSSHLEGVTGHLKNQLNPKCMTKLDWVEAQSKDKTIGEIIQLFKAKELHC